MTQQDAERVIAERGPRIRATYGGSYFNGWKAGILAGVRKESATQ